MTQSADVKIKLGAIHVESKAVNQPLRAGVAQLVD
jgi:hypothetical protein